MSHLLFTLGLLLMAAALVAAGILIGRRTSAPDPAAAPQQWVGISVYEGADAAAAQAAFQALQAREHEFPGDREWMSGDRHVRRFKVV